MSSDNARAASNFTYSYRKRSSLNRKTHNMEVINVNETGFSDRSFKNESADFSFWETLSITYVPYREYCFGIYHFTFENMTLQLYPWLELQKLLSLCEYMVVVRRTAFWIPLIIGIPGNILALLTILKFPKSTGTFYLALLAIFDFMALVTKVTNVVMLTFEIFDTISCKIIITLTNFTATYANWILVLICFERLVTVLYPLKKNYCFTLRRARLIALVVAVVIFLFDSVYLWIIIATDTCDTNDEKFHAKWIHVSTTMYTYLPSFLLIIMVLLIWRALKKIQKAREYIFCGESGTSSHATVQHRLQEQAKTERSITTMLLFAVITFIVLTLPLCVVLAVENINILEDSNFNSAYVNMAHVIAVGLSTLTHAVNFFIYFLSTERFRTHFRLLLCCVPGENKSTAIDRTVNTFEDHL